MATARNLSSDNAALRPNSTDDSLNSNSSLKNVAYWESRLFSSVYLRNDLKRDFVEKWERDFDDQVFDEDGNHVKSGFYHFYNEFRNIADSLRGFSRKNLSETDTITKIIVPLLDALGWYDNCTNNVEAPYAAETSFTVPAKPKNKTYRTDMILVDHPQEAGFVSDPEDNEKRKKEARRYCILPLEAKYWNRIVEREKSNLKEDKKKANKDSDDTSAGATFNEQVLNYMSILHKQWGIITDGNIWRLLNSEISSEAPERCFEFRIESLLDQESKIESGGSDEAEFMEAAKYFYLFFGKASFVKDELGKVFVDEVLKESRKYIDSIEEDLKDRFISAMNIMCDGLLKAAQKRGTIKRPTQDDLKLIRTVGESHLFNILFIKSCESRSILPIKSPNYYNISLTGIIDRISVFEPEKYTSKSEREYVDKKLANSLRLHNFRPEGSALYKNLIKLTEVIHEGAKKESYGFEISGFKESVFSLEEWRFAKEHVLSDIEMVKILFELGYSKASSSMQRNYQQIPYNYFTPRQLGSIYESFLEYKLDVADQKMVYLKKGKYKQWVKLTTSLSRKLLGHEPQVGPGQAFFTPDNKDRKHTGSFYTPDNIVRYIVENALGELVAEKTSEEILKIRVCDPAMGSGHFLISVLNFLSTKYAEAIENELPEEQIPSLEENRRKILDNCIYGIDINERAVKLAKLSLWLNTAHAGKKLENLKDQLFCGDALITDMKQYEFAFDWKKSIFDQKKFEGFDAIVGNPPWGSNIDRFSDYFHKNNEEVVKNYLEVYKLFVQRGITFLNPKGVFAMIIPNTFIAQPRYKDLRGYILKGMIAKVLNLGDGVFADVVAPSAIIFAQKSGRKDYEYASVAVNNKFLGNLSSVDWTIISHKAALSNPDFSLIEKRQLQDDEYPAVEVLEIKDAGIQYHRSGIGLKNKGGNDLYERLFTNSKSVFKNTRPVWYGKLINDYHVDLETDEFFNLDYKKALRESESASFNKDAFEQKPKIIWRQTAPYIKATIDSEGRWFRNTIQCGWVKDEFQKKLDLYYVLGLLNSSLLRMWYCEIVNEAAGKVFPQVKLTHIKKLPIKVGEPKAQAKIASLVKKLLSANKDIPSQSIIEEIDQLVYDVYDLKKSEIEAAEDFKQSGKKKLKAS